jgi:hypothetical protein
MVQERSCPVQLCCADKPKTLLADLLREKNTVSAEKNKLKKMDYKPDEQSLWNLD